MKNREFKKALTLCKEDKKLGAAVALIVGTPVANLTVKSVKASYKKLFCENCGCFKMRCKCTASDGKEGDGQEGI